MGLVVTSRIIGSHSPPGIYQGLQYLFASQVESVKTVAHMRPNSLVLPSILHFAVFDNQTCQSLEPPDAEGVAWR